MKKKPPTAIVPKQREAMLARYEEIQDTRAGEMMREDLVALGLCGENTARVGVFDDGSLVMFCGSEKVADALEPVVQSARHVRTRIVPKVTRETLNMLPSRSDDEEGK